MKTFKESRRSDMEKLAKKVDKVKDLDLFQDIENARKGISFGEPFGPSKAFL
jgi:hypothetical protein